MLKTNYQNAVLNINRNIHTKYRQIVNADGTISFEDVSDYEQTGDSFGANDMNTTNAEINLLEQVDDVTLVASAWTPSAPFIQTVTLERITENAQPIIAMGVPDSETSEAYKAMKKAYGYIDRVVSGEGVLTFYCYNKKPTQDINVFVKGV